MPSVKDRRNRRFRRDLNDLVRGADGKVAESKVWSNAGKATCLYLLLTQTGVVLETEFTLATLLTFLIAPELFKKFIAMRLGARK